jgi:hypothetical protein
MEQNVDFAAPLTGRTELITRLHAARARVERLLASHPPAALTAPGPEGWSVKDHLTHLTAWLRKQLALFAGRAAHEGLGVSESAWENDSEDELNAAVQQRDQHMTLDEALRQYRAAFDDLLAWLEGVDDGSLAAPFDADDPEAGRLIDRVPGNSYAHDLEHLPWMEAVLAAVAAKEAGR